MALRRTVYTTIASFISGPPKEIIPDINIGKTVAQTDGGEIMEIDPDDLTAFAILADAEEAIVLILTPQMKKDVIKALSGGLEIVGAGELHKLGGL